jgi:tetratricopeptide (TPR) repeat protein
MKLVRHIILFLLIWVTSGSVNYLFSQNVKTKPTRQSSFEAFSNGNYEKAFNEFSELLLTYSKDPLYKYYSGVCLVELKRDPAEAVTLLQEALQSASVIKTLPSDAMFYLGRAQQMSGKFMEAVASYNSYSKQIGKKTARGKGVPELIQQCNEKMGAISEVTTIAKESDKKDNVTVSQSEIKPVINETAPPLTKKEIPEKMAIPQDFENILDEALDLQFKADSLNSLVIEQKKSLETLPENERAALRVQIADNELLASSFQKLADQKYSEAQTAMKPQQEKNPPQEILKKTESSSIKDTVKIFDNKVVVETGKQTESIKRILPAVKKPVGALALFEVMPKPVSDPEEKIIIDPDVPDGLIYRIQMAVFRNPVSPAFFKGITPIYGFKVAGSDRTNYYAGMFRRSVDARKALTTVKSKGFNDAFVVAFMEKKPVSADRAAILEKEWGTKPFQEMVNSSQERPTDTIPPTLSFKVEIIRSIKPLKEDVVEGYKRLAGDRGLEIQKLDDGQIAYLIGIFITFESAEEYADLLIRNGYREAQVVAWLGNKEIPVETARQLFEKL